MTYWKNDPGKIKKPPQNMQAGAGRKMTTDYYSEYYSFFLVFKVINNC
jgi:hypothetical protein